MRGDRRTTVRDTVVRVLSLTAGSSGPAQGFISDDVDLLRDEQADRMRRARSTIADLDRILAAGPRRRPTPASARPRHLSAAEQQVYRRLEDLETRVVRMKATVAGEKMQRQIESLRRRLEASKPPLPIWSR